MLLSVFIDSRHVQLAKVSDEESDFQVKNNQILEPEGKIRNSENSENSQNSENSEHVQNSENSENSKNSEHVQDSENSLLLLL